MPPLPSPADAPPAAPCGQRWGRFAAAVAITAVVWLQVLPRLATWPAVQERIARHERLEINPGAIYYTESDATRQALIGLQSAQRRNASAWGLPARSPLWNQ